MGMSSIRVNGPERRDGAAQRLRGGAAYFFGAIGEAVGQDWLLKINTAQAPHPVIVPSKRALYDLIPSCRKDGCVR